MQMGAGLGSCDGVYAVYATYTADYIRQVVMGTATDCGGSTGLTPPPLDSCAGAVQKVSELGPSCGHGDDNGAPDPDYPRSPATCESLACVNYLASITDSSLMQMGAGLGSCDGVYAVYATYTADYIRQVVMGTAADCNVQWDPSREADSAFSGIHLKAADAKLQFGVKADGTPRCTIRKVPGESKLLSNCNFE